MEKRRICLFTAHSPTTGGGGVILRSLIPQLPDFSVAWFYVGKQAVAGYEGGYLGKALMGGSIVKDIIETRKMISGKQTRLIDDLVEKLIAVDCDAYWIVSHNEGLRIAFELSSRQSRPVHLTVHDDWAGALCARSARYRFMAGSANKLTIKTLNAVTSFDVISAGMRDYYQGMSGRTGDICHRYLSRDSILSPEINTLNKASSEIIAGHIGSIYSKADLISFLTLFNAFAQAKGKKPVLKMWGCHLNINDIPQELQSGIRFFDTQPEEMVLPELSRCDFVYAMYPLEKKLNIFSKTSLPTKLTSYLQAGRPIFGHGPADSTLAYFLKKTGLGGMWCSKEKSDGFDALKKTITSHLNADELDVARQQFFGEDNIRLMQRVLSDRSC